MSEFVIDATHPSTPIADAMLRKAACSDVSDETWQVLVHALGEVQPS